MIKRTNHSDRRILSFPAVHPCESISPATLLTSLITLANSVCNNSSNSFTTQRRNAREAIRQISILLIFFEELRDHGTNIPNSAVLCFSELHLTFQKIQFLMEDCTREGAKLWVLMKSQFIATQFRVLIRAIATALDVVQLDSVDVSGEVKELVDLVAKQARKARIELDRDDERAMKRVLSILNYFEKGVEPDLGFIKWVLDYLDIKNWSDCNKEIKFLEEIIALECSDCEEREVPFLSSLVAFMSYCRVVIFEELDNHSKDQIDVRCNAETLTCLNPEDFRCPISLELMIDPVTVATGQTYDRSSIHKWLKAGNMLCPKTGEKLTNTELVPNTTLKKLIQQFCADNGISLAKSGSQSRDITRTIIPGSPTAAATMKFISRFLARRLFFGTNEEKNKAACEIRLLAKSNIFNRSCIVESGTIPPLLNLLSSRDRYVQENAIAALLKLSKHTTGKKVIVESGGLVAILKVLESGLSLEARQIAAATLFYLSSVKGYRKLIGETPEAIPALVKLIKEGTTCGKRNAVVSIFGLLLHAGNHQRVLGAGAVPLLLDILASSHTKAELTTDSLAVLANLAENVEGTLTIRRTSSALPVITKLLQSLPSRAGKEYSVSILLSLCSNAGEEVTASLAKNTSLMTSLYSLTTDGTSHARRKARSLIRSLHQFSETSSSGFTGSAAPRERPVHVW